MQTTMNGADVKPFETEPSYKPYRPEEKAEPKAEKKEAKPAGQGGMALTKRTLDKLDWIHFGFLGYSGAHNIINAFHRADNWFFFLFVLVGILSVEYMLWCLYNYWRDGMLIGKMKRVAKQAGGLAMFFATAGILSQVQGFTGSAWLDFHYAWIMPLSSPVMFVYSFWIQAVDPVTLQQQDATAQAYFVALDERREGMDIREMKLEERKRLRKLEKDLNIQKIKALTLESKSRRTKATLKRAARVEMPYILERGGVSIKDANQQPLYTFLNSKYEVPKQLPAKEEKKKEEKPKEGQGGKG